VLGYYIGLGSSLRIAKSDSEDEWTDEADDSGDGIELMPDSVDEECKLVLVVRTDLGMGRGKVAAQCSHATLACYKAALRASPKIVRAWEHSGQPKITVQTKSEDELMMLQATALSLGLTARVIHDAGRTQIAAGSATVLGIGPAPKSVVDRVTGALKLY